MVIMVAFQAIDPHYKICLICLREYVLPKIFTNNLLPKPKLSLSYLVSPFINPPTKEHLFLTLHNLLLTFKKKRFKLSDDDTCTHCNLSPEDLHHTFNCTASQPSVKWIRRKVEKIDPAVTKESTFSLFTMNFNIVDTRKKWTIVWLLANFNSAIWESRKEPSGNITRRILADMNPKINYLKKTQLYSNCFYPL